ncbi:hypothetical protein F183_A10560 [Bryobacterales bacterium F-183]|nr:hypothetical protein F183_A10560 [Bryobacterales bacterium F-183]
MIRQLQSDCARTTGEDWEAFVPAFTAYGSNRLRAVAIDHVGPATKLLELFEKTLVPEILQEIDYQQEYERVLRNRKALLKVRGYPARIYYDSASGIPTGYARSEIASVQAADDADTERPAPKTRADLVAKMESRLGFGLWERFVHGVAQTSLRFSTDRKQILAELERRLNFAAAVVLAEYLASQPTPKRNKSGLSVPDGMKLPERATRNAVTLTRHLAFVRWAERQKSLGKPSTKVALAEKLSLYPSDVHKYFRGGTFAKWKRSSKDEALDQELGII